MSRTLCLSVFVAMVGCASENAVGENPSPAGTTMVDPTPGVPAMDEKMTTGNATCEPNRTVETISCIAEIAHSTTATKHVTCNSSGTGTETSVCALEACESGYSKDGNRCTANACVANASQGAVSCTETIGHSTAATKTKTCNATGTDFVYGACQLQSCESGYNVSGNTCVAQACTPNQILPAASCTAEISNSAVATKSKACNATGTDYVYGACTLQSCNAGYNKTGNACVLAPLPEVSNLRCSSYNMQARWDAVTSPPGVTYFFVRRANSVPLPGACNVTDEYSTTPATNGGLSSPWSIRVCTYQASTGRMSAGTTLSCTPAP